MTIGIIITQTSRYRIWLTSLPRVLDETAYTFVPVRERGGNNYLRLLYDVTGNRPELAKRYGNTSPGDGIKYAGKGFVQLTWKSNYVKQSRKLGIDLVSHPEMLLRLDVSTKVLVGYVGW